MAYELRSSATPAQSPAADDSSELEVRRRLLDATEDVVRKVTLAKLSMADVARAAGVARGTLYRYYESREALLDAALTRTADRFFREVGQAMDRCATLSEQLGEFSRMQIRSIHPEVEKGASRDALFYQLNRGEGTQALRRTSKFLIPYLEAARVRGEIRDTIDVTDAGEWLARILLSFSVFHAAMSYEATDPDSVSSFVQRYAIDGLSAHHLPNGSPPE